jgi:hypothetical protein
MSGKKNKCDIERRRNDIVDEINTRSNEKTESVINEIADRLYLRPSTIWNDLKMARSINEIAPKIEFITWTESNEII